MRSIGPGLRTYLDAHASTSGKAVKLQAADQSDFADGAAYFVINRKATENYIALDDGEGDGLRAETFQILAYATTNKEAQELTDAVAAQLATFTGAMGSDRVAVDIEIEDESGDFDPTEFGDEAGRFVSELVIWIQHKAA